MLSTLWRCIGSQIWNYIVNFATNDELFAPLFPCIPLTSSFIRHWAFRAMTGLIRFATNRQSIKNQSIYGTKRYTKIFLYGASIYNGNSEVDFRDATYTCKFNDIAFASGFIYTIFYTLSSLLVLVPHEGDNVWRKIHPRHSLCSYLCLTVRTGTSLLPSPSSCPLSPPSIYRFIYGGHTGSEYARRRRSEFVGKRTIENYLSFRWGRYPRVTIYTPWEYAVLHRTVWGW